MLRHVVCFRFKGDAKEAQIQKVVEAFSGLKKRMPVVKDFMMESIIALKASIRILLIALW